MSEDIVRAIESLYESVERAFQKGDIDDVDALLAPDFVAYDGDGAAKSRAEVLAEIRELMRTLRDVRWPRRVTAVRLEGEDAIATTSGVLSGTRADGTVLELDTAAEDVWRQTPTGWQNRAARSLK